MINLTITKRTTKIRKQKDKMSNLCKYSLSVDISNFILKQISNFKFSDILLTLCGTKNKVKRKERGMMKIIFYLVSSESNSQIANARGSALRILRFFENFYAVDTHQIIKDTREKKAVIYVKKLKQLKQFNAYIVLYISWKLFMIKSTKTILNFQ